MGRFDPLDASAGVALNLRKHANGLACIMCGKNDGSTVLHHLRVGNPGMGKKPPDHHGIEVCAGCHDFCHHEGIANHHLQLISYLRQIDRWLADGTLKL